MEETNRELALIIKRSDWRENDSRVVLYSRKRGKITLIARGAKKFKSKLAAHIEPLSLVNIMVLKGRVLDYLGGAIIEEAFLNIKKDLNALYFVGLAWSLLDQRVKDEAEDEELFDFAFNWLLLVNNLAVDELHKDEGELLLNYFSLQLLNITGYKPELYHCLECQKRLLPGLNYFSLRQGGIIDEKCYLLNKPRYLPNEVMAVSDNCIKLMRLLLESSNYPSIKDSASISRELGRTIKSFLIFHS